MVGATFQALVRAVRPSKGTRGQSKNWWISVATWGNGEWLVNDADRFQSVARIRDTVTMADGGTFTGWVFAASRVENNLRWMGLDRGQTIEEAVRWMMLFHSRALVGAKAVSRCACHRTP